MAPAVPLSEPVGEELDYKVIRSVKEIAESGITRVPARFIQPAKVLQKSLSPEEAGRTIPLVDISGLEDDRRSSILAQIAKGCKEWGAFNVVNHGVSPELMDETLKVHRAFYELPLDEKLKYKNPKDPRVAFGTGNKYKPNPHPWKDYLQFVLDEPINDANWPNAPSTFREVQMAYTKSLAVLKDRIVAAIIDSLGMSQEAKEEAKVLNVTQVQVSHYYPPCPEVDLVMGVQPHSDANTLTILHEDSVGCVDAVPCDKYEWVYCPPVPHAFTIFIGDQIEMFTNGRYPSSLHRARAHPEKVRISIGTFFVPPRQHVVRPAAELLANEPSLYREVAWEDCVQYLRDHEDEGYRFFIKHVKLTPDNVPEDFS